MSQCFMSFVELACWQWSTAHWWYVSSVVSGKRKVGGGRSPVEVGWFIFFTSCLFPHSLSLSSPSLSSFPFSSLSSLLSPPPTPLPPPSLFLPLPLPSYPLSSPSSSSPSSSHPSSLDHIGDTDRAWGQNSFGSWSKASILQGTYHTVCTQEKSGAGALKRGHYWAKSDCRLGSPYLLYQWWKTSLRIFGDFKVTVNQVSKLDMHPIPKIDNLFVILTGGKRLQNLTCPKHTSCWRRTRSRKHVVVNTHRSLFRYSCLPLEFRRATERAEGYRGSFRARSADKLINYS